MNAYYPTQSVQLIQHRTALQRCHNEHNGVSNHQRLDGLLNRLLRRISKKTSKLRVTGRCERNSPVTGEFHSQMASNPHNVSIWLRNHEAQLSTIYVPKYILPEQIHIFLSLNTTSRVYVNNKPYIAHYSRKRVAYFPFKKNYSMTAYGRSCVRDAKTIDLGMTCFWNNDVLAYQQQIWCWAGFTMSWSTVA